MNTAVLAYGSGTLPPLHTAWVISVWLRLGYGLVYIGYQGLGQLYNSAKVFWTSW